MRVLDSIDRKQRCSRKTAASRTILPLVLVGFGCCARASGPSQGADQRFPAPTELWRWTSDTEIVDLILLSDGGAVLGTWCCAEDKKPGANTVYRIQAGGEVAWRFTEDRRRVGLHDVSSDGRLVLVIVTSSPESNPKQMKLLLLDRSGKVIRASQLADSAWLWLSPDGEDLLRWDNQAQTLILEEAISGKRIWVLEDVQPPVKPIHVDFVVPVLQAGYVLIGDAERGVIEGVTMRGIPGVTPHGEHLWRIKTLKWHTAPAPPLVVSADGRWIAVDSSLAACQSSMEVELLGDTGSSAYPGSLVNLDDTLALIRVPVNDFNPRLPGNAAVVWERTMRTSAVRIPRSGIYGAALHMDLLDRKEGDKTLPSLTVLTDMALTTFHFDGMGVLQKETAWPVPQVTRVSQAWLLPSGHLLIKRPKTSEAPQALQILDEAGKVLFELKPEKEILSVSFDRDRRYMLVKLLREVRAFGLN